MFNWANNDWIKADKKTPENLDIIKEYYDLYNSGYDIRLILVKGHNGIYGNEIADKLAVNDIKGLKKIIQKNNIEDSDIIDKVIN